MISTNFNYKISRIAIYNDNSLSKSLATLNNTEISENKKVDRVNQLASDMKFGRDISRIAIDIINSSHKSSKDIKIINKLLYEFSLYFKLYAATINQ